MLSCVVLFCASWSILLSSHFIYVSFLALTVHLLFVVCESILGMLTHPFSCCIGSFLVLMMCQYVSYHCTVGFTGLSFAVMCVYIYIYIYVCVCV